MRFSISGKVMVIYGSIFIAIIFLTFGLSYYGTVGRLEQDLKNTHLALLKQIDDKIEITFRTTEKDLLNLSQQVEYVYFMYDSYDDPSQKYANFFALSNKLKTIVSTNEQLSSVFVYSDASKDMMTDKSFLQRSDSADNWLAGYIDMEGYSKWISTHKVWDGDKEHNAVTHIRPYPLISSPGYRKGLVAVNITEDELFRIMGDVYDGGQQDGHTFIIDGSGGIVTHDDKSRLYTDMTDEPYIKRILGGNGNGQFTVKSGGAEQSVFYRTSAYTGWKIVSVVPQSQLYQPLESLRKLMIAIASLMVVMALTALFFVNRRTFKPLDRLAGKLSGSLRHVKAGQTGSLGYLETAFDQMFTDREQLEKRVRDSKPALKWRMVMDMLTGYRTDYASVSRQLEFIGIRLLPEMFVVCTAEFDKDGGIGPKDETLYAYALCNVAEEVINMENAGIAVDLGASSAAIIFSFAEGDEEQNHLRAFAAVEQILDIMRRQFGLLVTAGVGRCYRDMSDIPRSYDESQKALQYRMVIGSHSVISVLDLIGSDNQDYYRIIKMTDRIVEALRQTEYGKLNEFVAELFREAVGGGLSPELLRQLSYELVMKSLQGIAATGIDTEETLAGLGNLHERIGRCSGWKDLEDIVLAALEQMARKIEDKRMQRGSHKAIEKMVAYIQEHYGQSEFSLDRLADKFELSPTYISKLFKEHMERNFIDYLIEIRINASKELLLDKNRKVNDVAEAVGYTNTRSFLRAFKKYTGMTPSEYRDSAIASQASPE
ncbi:helix-turn-helix domain-containing protein [Paenibacillus hodogayensis]|uniref:Helix-turn-helix domain-containing protein n=1 Tax=Paenibacillus hodogayensis TaxID=279208 RepID=A0ABV5VXW5_9BACL